MPQPKDKYKEVRFPYTQEKGKRFSALIGGEIQSDFVKEGERVLLVKMPQKEKVATPPEVPTMFQTHHEAIEAGTLPDPEPESEGGVA
jgi:hypothetical protein